MNNKSKLELDLHAYVDGNLDEAAMDRVERYLREHPEAARRVWSYMQQKDDIRRFATRTVGDDLTPAEQRLGNKLSSRLRPSKTRNTGLVLAFGAMLLAGWFGHSIYQLSNPSPYFTREMVQAHLLSTVDPTDIPALTTERVNRLFARIGEWEPLPDLRTYGFEPVGAQLVPSAEGLVLHIPYRRSDGASVSYFILHLNEDAEVEPNFITRDGINVVYWQHDQARHAIATPLPRETMASIVSTIDRDSKGS